MSIPFLTMGTAPTLRSDGTEEPIGGISDKISNLVSNTYNKFFSKKSNDIEAEDAPASKDISEKYVPPNEKTELLPSQSKNLLLPHIICRLQHQHQLLCHPQ